MLLISGLVAALTAFACFQLFPYIVKVMKYIEDSEAEKIQLVEVVESCMDSILVLSSNLLIVGGNTATNLLYGSNFKNHSVLEFIWNSEYMHKFQDSIDSLLLNNDNDQKQVTIQYQCYSPETNEPVWYESVIRKRKKAKESNHNNDYEFMMITRNIEEQKKAQLYQASLESQKQMELDRINEAKLMYITCVAHDLKTPLQSFSSTLDLLVNTNLRQEQVELVEDAKVASELMKLTISQAMNTGKSISGGTLTPRKVTFSLRSLMLKMKTIISNTTKIPIYFEVADSVHDSIISDQEWLSLILLNLLTNASKYTLKGSIVVATFIDPLEDQTLVIEVRDSG